MIMVNKINKYAHHLEQICQHVMIGEIIKAKISILQSKDKGNVDLAMLLQVFQ